MSTLVETKDRAYGSVFVFLGEGFAGNRKYLQTDRLPVMKCMMKEMTAKIISR